MLQSEFDVSDSRFDSGELRHKALAWEVRTPRPGVVGQNPVITAALEKIAKADEGEGISVLV
jgi:hypothetical protein